MEVPLMVVCVMVLLFSLPLALSLFPCIVLPGWRWPGVAGCHPLGGSRLYPLLVDILHFSIAFCVCVCVCVCVCPSFSLNGLCNSGPAYAGCWSPLFLSSFTIYVIFCTPKAWGHIRDKPVHFYNQEDSIQFSTFSVSHLHFIFLL